MSVCRPPRRGGLEGPCPGALCLLCRVVVFWAGACGPTVGPRGPAPCAGFPAEPRCSHAVRTPERFGVFFQQRVSGSRVWTPRRLLAAPSVAGTHHGVLVPPRWLAARGEGPGFRAVPLVSQPGGGLAGQRTVLTLTSVRCPRLPSGVVPRGRFLRTQPPALCVVGSCARALPGCWSLYVPVPRGSGCFTKCF